MCVRAAEGCRCAGLTTSEAESVSQGHTIEGTHSHTEDTDTADRTRCLRRSPAGHAHSALQVHKHMDICDIPGVPAWSLYTTGTSAWILTLLSCPTGLLVQLGAPCKLTALTYSSHRYPTLNTSMDSLSETSARI